VVNIHFSASGGAVLAPPLPRAPAHDRVRGLGGGLYFLPRPSTLANTPARQKPPSIARKGGNFIDLKPSSRVSCVFAPPVGVDVRRRRHLGSLKIPGADRARKHTQRAGGPALACGQPARPNMVMPSTSLRASDVDFPRAFFARRSREVSIRRALRRLLPRGPARQRGCQRRGRLRHLRHTQ